MGGVEGGGTQLAGIPAVCSTAGRVFECDGERTSGRGDPAGAQSRPMLARRTHRPVCPSLVAWLGAVSSITFAGVVSAQQPTNPPPGGAPTADPAKPAAKPAAPEDEETTELVV